MEKNSNLIYNEDNEILINFFHDKKNKTYKKFPEFLQFNESFPKAGKQGLLGTLIVNTDEGKKEVVYKISQYINYLADHESSILTSLNDIRSFCPHFCNGFGKITLPMDADFRKVENPFEISSGLKISGDVMLMENISPAKKLYRYLKKDEIKEDIIFSLIKQSLIAVNIAQNKKQLAHYDLHSNNILINKCNPNSCFLYILDENHKYLLPTYGYYPKIIDFGFGYIQDMNNKPLRCPLMATDVGFMSDRFDPVADPKLFLVTVSDEMVGYRGTKKSKIFRKIVKNIFKPLKIDWESGWDDVNDMSASSYITNLLEETENKSKSKFFKNYGHYCVDLSQKLINLPLTKHKYKDIDTIYKEIINEFKNIESQISNAYYNLYIFKNMIDFALEVRDEYLNERTRNHAIKKFKNNLFDLISRIAKFCNPKLDYDKLLACLYVFAKKMSGVMYEVLSERMKDKEKEYKKMKLQSTSEIFEALDCNIPSEFELNEETEIYVFDCVNERSSLIKLPNELITEINEIHPSSRGEYIYDHLKDLKDDDESDLSSLTEYQSEEDNNDESDDEDIDLREELGISESESEKYSDSIKDSDSDFDSTDSD